MTISNNRSSSNMTNCQTYQISFLTHHTTYTGHNSPKLSNQHKYNSPLFLHNSPLFLHQSETHKQHQILFNNYYQLPLPHKEMCCHNINQNVYVNNLPPIHYTAT